MRKFQSVCGFGLEGMSSMIHKTTINDIARELGISKSTVSRALAGNDDVKAETREAVRAMAEKMNYIPNHMAQNLTKRRTRVIGVVVPEFINSFFSRIIIQIQKVFESEGYRVLITQCNDSWEVERRNLELLEENMVEGILLSVTEKGKNKELYKTLIDRGIPIIFFNRDEKGIDTSRVIIDDYKWSFFAAEHLIYTRRAMGCANPRILHFQGPANIDLSKRRYRGYVDAMEKHRIEVSNNSILSTEVITRDEGFRIMSSYLEENPAPDGIFCFNDQLAIGAMRALKHYGIKIPETTSVIGFSESQSALITVPALSSVAQPLEQMGVTASRLLLEKIDSPSSPSRTVVLDAVLNVRGSSDPSKVIL